MAGVTSTLIAPVSIPQAADILWTYSAPELYDLLVRRSGWDLPRYSAFVTAGIASQLAR